MYRKKADKLNRILILLSKEKELSQKQIKSLTELPYTQVVRGLTVLSNSGLVTFRTETGREQHRKGPASNIWSITDLGLAHVLAKITSIEEVELIANTHSEMLLVLKKWSLFKKADLDECMFFALKLTLEDIAITARRFQGRTYTIDAWREQIDNIIVDRLIFGEVDTTTKEDREKRYFELCKHDPELNKLIENAFTEEEKEHVRIENIKARWDRVMSNA